MDNITFAEHLAQLSEKELTSLIENAWASLDPRPRELITMVHAERSRRHALVCQDLECGFRPWD